MRVNLLSISIVAILLQQLAQQTDAEPVGICPPENGELVNFLTHATNCSKFYKCNWGSPVEFDCPDGLHFNSNLNVCDWPRDAGCDDSSTAAPTDPEPPPPGNGTTTTIRPPTGSCPNDPCPAINGQYPVYFPNADCGKFCICDWGVAYEMECPEGLHFNPKLNVCDWPRDAGCDDSSAPSPPTDPEPELPGNGTTTTARPGTGSCPNDPCPAINGEYPVYFPHADCGKFCQCDWGVAYEMECPEGLHFNPTKNVCDWPRDAGCDDSSAPSPPTDPEPELPGNGTTTTARPGTGSCPNDPCPAINGEYPVYFPHADCGKFCQCDWGVAYEMECPEGLHFNPTKNVCDWPRDAGCDDSSAPSPPTDPEPELPGNGTTTTARPGTGSCPNDPCPAINGEYPVYFPHADCGKFCQCDWGVAYEMECPEGLHFNPTKNVCDWPRDAGCDDSSAPSPPTDPEPELPGNGTTTTARPGTGSCPNDPCPAINGEYPVYFPHADCGKFCQCDWGVAYEMECPEGLHFNPTKNVCDWPRDAGCDDSSAPSPPTDPEPELPGNGTTTTARPGTGSCPNDPCPAINGEYPVYFPHADCGKFCQCDWGVAYEMECPEGLHFNPAKNVCDWPRDAGCDDSSAPSPPTDPEPELPGNGTTTTARPGTGSCPNDPCPAINGEYPVYFPHADCGKFCQCDWGVAHEMECPEGLHFNPTLYVCDWPRDAGCDDSSAPSPPTDPEPELPGNGTTTTARPGTGSCPNDPCPAINGEYPVYFPHADCGKFCQCDWGVAYEMECPEGLHFNPTKNVCDWPRDAGCDDSSAPSPPTDPEPELPGNGTTTTARPGTGSCPNDPCPAINGEYPVYFPHADCGKFCQCDWGVAYEMECPEGLHFNPAKNVCDWPRDAGCDDSSAPSPPTDPEPELPGNGTTTTARPGTGSCPNDPCPAINGEYPVYFPHADCGKFCQCDWGVAHEMECPEGLHFNPTLYVCDWPRDAGCDDSSAPSPPTDPEPELPGNGTTTTARPGTGSCPNDQCPAINGEYPVYFPHADCGKFCQCDWGVAYEMECPEGLHFNPTKNVCDWPRDAGCDDSSAPSPPTDPEPELPGNGTTTTARPGTGSCPNDPCPAINGEYPVYFPHADCGKFCQCDWGVAYEMECPEGLHFNPTKNVCDWPRDAGCDDSSAPSPPTDPEPELPGNGTTTTARPGTGSCPNDPCPAINGEYPVYFPHADCGKFCQCDWGVAYEMECPEGLHFNPTKNVCDWPRDAGCDDSSAPSPPTDPEPELPGNGTTTTARPGTGSCPNDPCPAINGEYPVYFPHADCGKFCQCDWGVAYEMECPEGLHFNPTKNVCDWPRDAGCDDSSAPSPPTDPEPELPGNGTTTTARPGTGSCPNDPCPAINGEYPVYFPHADCGKFCQCDWGVAYEMECPEGLHFNPAKNVCDWPRDAGCDDSSAPSPPTDPEPELPGNGTTTTARPGTGSCPNDPCPAINGEYPVYFPHADCGKFCQCDWGVAHEMECPEGLHFNPTLYVCDWPRDAGCDDSSAPSPPTDPEPELPGNGTTTTARPGTGSCPNDQCPAINGEYPVYFPHADCGKFCQCDWGVAYEMECPEGLHFNPAKNVCDWPRDAGCDDSSAPSPPTDPEPELPGNGTTTTARPGTGSCPNDPCPAINGEYPVYFPHADCGKFCQCDWGVAYEMECPQGLHFNPAKNVCDWPRDAGCDDSSAPSPPTDPEPELPGNGTTTTARPGTGSCPNDPCPAINGEYPVYFPHADCGKFCQCDWGVAYEMECPEGLHFNPAKNVCDWPRDAGCDDSSAPSPPTDPEPELPGNGTTTTARPGTGSCPNDPCPAINGEYPVYFPHADCGKFCQCDWGVAHEMECPEGLHFNPTKNVCDWPRDAGCDDSSAPSPPTDPEPELPGNGTTTTIRPPTDSCPNDLCPVINEGAPVSFPHANCGKFCQCDGGGVAHERECPEGLHFNPTLNMCDFPWDAGCDDSITPPSPTDPEPELPGNGTTTTIRPPTGSCPNDPCPAINGEYPVYFPQADCGKFCKCDWGEAYEMKCPEGLHFNPTLNVCDWPRDAGCDDSSTPTDPEPGLPGNGTTTTIRPSTGSCSNDPCPATNGKYPVYFPQGDCGKFCICDWGVAYEMICPDDLHFNPQLNVCDWPRDAGCNGQLQEAQ